MAAARRRQLTRRRPAGPGGALWATAPAVPPPAGGLGGQGLCRRRRDAIHSPRGGHAAEGPSFRGPVNSKRALCGVCRPWGRQRRAREALARDMCARHHASLLLCDRQCAQGAITATASVSLGRTWASRESQKEPRERCLDVDQHGAVGAALADPCAPAARRRGAPGAGALRPRAIDAPPPCVAAGRGVGLVRLGPCGSSSRRRWSCCGCSSRWCTRRTCRPRRCCCGWSPGSRRCRRRR